MWGPTPGSRSRQLPELRPFPWHRAPEILMQGAATALPRDEACSPPAPYLSPRPLPAAGGQACRPSPSGTCREWHCFAVLVQATGWSGVCVHARPLMRACMLSLLSPWTAWALPPFPWGPAKLPSTQFTAFSGCQKQGFPKDCQGEEGQECWVRQ